MIIDVENHLFLEEQTRKDTFKSGKICERYWDSDGKLKFYVTKDASSVDRLLRFMDDAGIDMAVLTNGSRSLEQQKKWHNHCADLVKEYPKRLLGLATIEPLGGKPAFDELERAVKELGMKGVNIRTRNDGCFLDSPEMWFFYEKVAELRIPVSVHVEGDPLGFDALNAPYALYYVIARELDMCASTLRVCLGGVLEDFPDLIFIMNHFGGGISAIKERVDAFTSYASSPGWANFYFGKRLINKPWYEYFNKLYFNMAGREVGINAIKCALTNISPNKLMFATDWPMIYDYEPDKVKQCITEIKKLDLPREDVDAMLGGNAAKLFGINIKS